MNETATADAAPIVRLRLDSFKPMVRASLRGFVTITIEPIGLTIEDVHIHQASSGAPYALLPSKAQIKADGSVIRRDDGKIAYTPVLKFANREASDRFSIGVVELVRRRFPEALP
jgi:hypothetical protein